MNGKRLFVLVVWPLAANFAGVEITGRQESLPPHFAFSSQVLSLPVADIPSRSGITPQFWRGVGLVARRRTHPLQTGPSGNPGVSLTLGGLLPPGASQEALLEKAKNEIVKNHRLFRGLTRDQAERLKILIGDSVTWNIRWEGSHFAMYYDSFSETFVIAPEDSAITIRHFRDTNFSSGSFDNDSSLGRAMQSALRHYAHVNQEGKPNLYLRVGTYQSIRVEIRQHVDFPETVIDRRTREATIIVSRAIYDAIENPETATEKARLHAQAVLISEMGHLLQPLEEDDAVEPRALEVFVNAFGLRALLNMHTRVELSDGYLTRLAIRAQRRGLESALKEIVLLNEFSEPVEFSARVVRAVLQIIAANFTYANLDNGGQMRLLREIHWGNQRSPIAAIFDGLWKILPNRTYIDVDGVKKDRRNSPADEPDNSLLSFSAGSRSIPDRLLPQSPLGEPIFEMIEEMLPNIQGHPEILVELTGLIIRELQAPRPILTFEAQSRLVQTLVRLQLDCQLLARHQASAIPDNRQAHYYAVSHDIWNSWRGEAPAWVREFFRAWAVGDCTIPAQILIGKLRTPDGFDKVGRNFTDALVEWSQRSGRAILTALLAVRHSLARNEEIALIQELFLRMTAARSETYYLAHDLLTRSRQHKTWCQKVRMAMKLSPPPGAEIPREDRSDYGHHGRRRREHRPTHEDHWRDIPPNYRDLSSLKDIETAIEGGPDLGRVLDESS